MGAAANPQGAHPGRGLEANGNEGLLTPSSSTAADKTNLFYYINVMFCLKGIWHMNLTSGWTWGSTNGGELSETGPHRGSPERIWGSAWEGAGMQGGMRRGEMLRREGAVWPDKWHGRTDNRLPGLGGWQMSGRPGSPGSGVSLAPWSRH